MVVRAQGQSGSCPAGVQAVELAAVNMPERAPPPSSPDSVRPVRHPAPFAEPSQLSAPITAASHGTWTSTLPDGSRTWQLCLNAPATATSLTIIFSQLQLPLHAELRVHAPGRTPSQPCAADCQLFSAYHNVVAGGASTVPIAGHTLMLSYLQPAAASRGLLLVIREVLQGVVPLPAAFAAWHAAHPSETAAPPLLKHHQQPGATVNSPIGDYGDQQAPSYVASPQQSGQQQETSDIGSSQQAALSDALVAAVDQRNGAALACLPDASCFPRWKNLTDAVVLLMLASPYGGRFCTGTLLNAAPPTTAPGNLSTQPNTTPSPASAAQPPVIPASTGTGTATSAQYILTANHCRGLDDDLTIATLWGVVFSRNDVCTSNGTQGTRQPGLGSSPLAGSIYGPDLQRRQPVPSVTPHQVLQGLRVVWGDEFSDVLLLELVDEIPEGGFHRIPLTSRDCHRAGQAGIHA